MGKGLLDLEKHFAFYGAYHSNQINIAIHMVFVWPIFFTALLMLYFTPSLFHLPHLEFFLFGNHFVLVLNFGFLLALIYAVFYVCLDVKAGSLAALLCAICWVASSFIASRLGFSLAWKIDCRNYRNMSSLSNHNFAAVLPGDSVAGLVVANGILNFLNIYNTVLIVRLVLTWFPNAPSVIVSPLSTLCDPYLNIFRGIIPPLGGLDLSPILAFLVLNAFTSTASALPAELPGTRTSEEGPASHSKFTNLTTSQKKWLLRLQGNRSKSSSGVN